MINKTIMVPDSEVTRVLHTRALALSRPLKSAETAVGTSLDLLEFRLAKERYALETEYVREVYPLKELTPLPCTPPFMRGVVNLRGQITPVIDIKKFFDLPDGGITDLHCVILVQGKGLEFGILADIVVGIRVVLKESLQPSLPTLTGIRSDYLRGVTAERLIVLDLDHVLADPRIIVQEEVEN